MYKFQSSVLALAIATSFIASVPSTPAAAQVTVGITITANIAPPPLPVYDQPEMPGDGYIWTPGYWSWDSDVADYYWVPGTWVQAPEVDVVWTPGYWGYNEGVYVFNTGYWGHHIGYYGGINYGYGYGGDGYYGGYWQNNVFFYNHTVNNFGSVHIVNVYEKVVINNVTINHFSYNGPGGLQVKPTPEQLVIGKEKHIPMTVVQTQHVQAAHGTQGLFSKQNHGLPPIASTSHAGELKGPGVTVSKPIGPITQPTTPSNKPTTVLKPTIPSTIPTTQNQTPVVVNHTTTPLHQTTHKLQVHTQTNPLPLNTTHTTPVHQQIHTTPVVQPTHNTTTVHPQVTHPLVTHPAPTHTPPKPPCVEPSCHK